MKALADEQIDSLASTWIDALRRGEEAAADQVHQSVVILTFAYSPETQWKFILAATEAAGETIEELYAIAAGPFEGLMGKGRQGEEYIDRVESCAASSEKFRNMLHGSWRHGMSEDVWARGQAAAGQPTLP